MSKPTIDYVRHNFVLDHDTLSVYIDNNVNLHITKEADGYVINAFVDNICVDTMIVYHETVEILQHKED